jgi:hypothetical protein
MFLSYGIYKSINLDHLFSNLHLQTSYEPFWRIRPLAEFRVDGRTWNGAFSVCDEFGEMRATDLSYIWASRRYICLAMDPFPGPALGTIREIGDKGVDIWSPLTYFLWLQLCV